ncbi:MAG: aspartate carbamoyltransferase regulatory subunit, partial [Candidatus Bathyarchaeota archaeon]
MSRRTLRVSKIKEGTVIDHITGGHALDVIKILGITGRSGGIVTVAMNVPSKILKFKDIL